MYIYMYTYIYTCICIYIYKVVLVFRNVQVFLLYYFYIHLLLNSVAMQNLQNSRKCSHQSEVVSCVSNNRKSSAAKNLWLSCIHTDSQRGIQTKSFFL